jgi:hypothetical protein
MRGLARASVVGAFLLLLAAHGTAFAQPRRVLLLHSFGPQFEPWTSVAGHFREELSRRLPQQVDLLEASLMTARFAQTADESPLVDYLRAVLAGHQLDLVVSLGVPAARFFQKYRPQFFPTTPLVIAAADQRAFSESALTVNDTTVASTLDLPKLIENILQVSPDTTRIAYVIGGSPLDRYWAEVAREAYRPFEGRVTFEWFTELSQDEMVKRAATLPPRSALFYASVRVDAAGIPNEHDRVLKRLRESANAPIFSYLDNHFGQGIVVGPLLSTQEIGRGGRRPHPER